MMTSVDQHLCLRTGEACQMNRHSPVSDVRVIESRFEGLVFDKQALSRRELVMRSTQRLFKPSLTLSDVRGAGVVGSVSKPHGDIATLESATNFDAVFHMRKRAFPDSWVGIAERTVFVLLILKKVWVNRSSAHSKAL